ncbi:alpha/beta hydrolase family protein [Leeuwenhoekiella marinoflava]|uniref:alpha/beta hydrolase family protein n=1 Tax=Leeuwenhoekiella marinoflava TaxID=988 RepID=UPI0030019548
MISLKSLFIAVLLLSCTHLVNAQEYWQGQYNSKRLLLSKTVNTTMQDSLHLSSPENMYDSMPLAQDIVGDSLVLTNETFGKILKLNELYGDSMRVRFTDYGNTYNIKFRRVTGLQPLMFPQHPKGDLPYSIKEIEFKGEKTKLTYGGTLVIPKETKNYPLAFLLNGTGQQDRNYTYSGHQFFTVLADALARSGIASFRMDDRGIGGTTGDFQQATIEDFVMDLEDAKTYLKDQKYIDAEYMGIIGHSEGGVVASIASAKDKDLKFMVSLSGVGVNGLKILDLQNTAILKAYQIPDTTVVHQMDLFNNLFKTVYTNQNPDSLEAELNTTVKTWMHGKNQELLKAVQLADGRDQNLVYRFYSNAKSDAYQYMLHYEPQDFLPDIKIPVLAINGGSDILVPAEENLAGFKKYLTNSSDFSFKIYPGLNHMYQHCTTCTSEEIKTLDEVFAPEVLNDISKWIINNYNNHKE